MSISIRPLVAGDLERLAELDGAYSSRHGLERAVNLAALRFFERSGHSFVAEVGDAAVVDSAATDSTAGAELAGFLLAQAVWTGERPTVHAHRLAAHEDATAEARAALAGALVKSAYDAGVYDLVFRTPRTDDALRTALLGEGYLEDDHVTLTLVLGTRAAAWAEGRRG
ncbi:MAG: DUF1999 family protein [Trueperaceae bacterium]|nr:DUF1999 family protein [Trueperaceae bacterium]MCC6309658.1 DUF1999 family protein [Trueperaceae bacterium]MCO5172914.1 DUF1999 domain-containing protein [Trueperaceae bacterium]MCW5820524.1 DUF1999 family protein [Trueperaceae bacterium]